MDDNKKTTISIDTLMQEFTKVTQAYNALAHHVISKGHSDWVIEAEGLSIKKKMQANPKTNIIPSLAWKEACKKLDLPFEFISQGKSNG